MLLDTFSDMQRYGIKVIGYCFIAWIIFRLFSEAFAPLFLMTYLIPLFASYVSGRTLVQSKADFRLTESFSFIALVGFGVTIVPLVALAGQGFVSYLFSAFIFFLGYLVINTVINTALLCLGLYVASITYHK